MTKAWQGRLPGGTDARVERFTESISVDYRLLDEDIDASIAHATMLGEVGLISAEESARMIEALNAIRDEFAQGRVETRIELEDIHLHVETELIRRLGDVGRKLHTGRSRNDQVVTDLKLWLRRRLDQLSKCLIDVQRALVEVGERYVDLILPAYTHLQRAQPVLAGHYFLAYVEKYQRDLERVADCRRRLNVLPLGAAALAGTSLPIDRRRVAELLGFDGIADNSLDVSSDRDFVIESASVLAMIALHLSGWAEEWILWSTTEFDFIEIPDAFCTGSSIMPHKKNPDILELTRGRSARVLGALQTLLVLTKGLPLAYNRDLQEDKPPIFDAVETVLAALEMKAAVVRGATLRRSSIESRLEDGFLDATTLMEAMILAGVPMRSAHEAVGALVRRAIADKKRLIELDEQAFDAVLPGRATQLRRSLGARSAIQAFKSEGSTAPDKVKTQLDLWKKRLERS